MTTHTIYQDIFNEQLGASDERIKVVIETIDSNGDGSYEAIKVTMSVFDEDTDGDGMPDSNSGTEDMIGIAFDIGDDSLISSLGLTIDDITLSTVNRDTQETSTIFNAMPASGTDFLIGADSIGASSNTLGIQIDGKKDTRNDPQSPDDANYDAAVAFKDGGGSISTQEASFLITSSTGTQFTDADVQAILNNTDWYIRLQSTDGGQQSAKTAGFILDIGQPPNPNNPAIDLEKEVSIDGGETWVDADTADEALSIVEGTHVQFKVVAQNTGNVDLTNVVLSDSLYDLNGDATGTDVTIAELTVGSSETYIYTTTWQAGLQTNTASATSDQGVTDSDNGNYFGADPSLSIDKVTNGADGQEILAGTALTWRYTVNNTGNVGLSNVNVTDDQNVAVSYVSGDDGDNVLEVGETWIYEGLGTATEGAYNNVGTVTGDYTDDNSTTESPTASDPSDYFGAAPAISIDKVTNGADGQEILAGTALTWTYTVANEGNVDLANVSVSDDQGVTVNYISGDDGDNLLEMGETWIYEGTGTAVVGDYSNIGTVTSSYTDDLGNTANPTDTDPSDYFGAAPAIFIDKVTNGADGLEILEGTDITWQYTVSNIGNVGLSDISVTDDNGTADTADDFIATYKSGDTNTDGILDTTETWTFEATGTAVEGAYSNIGTVTSSYTDDLGNTANPTDTDPSDYFGAAPSLFLDKVADFTPYSENCTKVNVGDVITYTFSVLNDGNVAINDVSVTDSLITNGSLSITSGVDDDHDGDIDTLGVGETATFTATYTVTDADGNAGEVVNTANANSIYTDDVGGSVTLTSSGTETVLVNRPPDAIDNSYVQPKNVTSTIGNAIIDDTGEGVDSDPDGDALSIDIANSDTTSAFGGTIDWNEDGTFTYTPDNGFAGFDQFDYTIVDACGGKDTATVFLEVETQNQRSIMLNNVTAGLDDLTGQPVDDVVSGTFDVFNQSGEPGLQVQIISVDVNYDQKSNPNGRGPWEDVDPSTYANEFWVDSNADGLLNNGETLLEDLDPSANRFQIRVTFEDSITIGYASTFDDNDSSQNDVPDPLRVSASAEIYGRSGKEFGFTESFDFS